MGHKVPQSQYFHGLWHSFFFSTVKDGIIAQVDQVRVLARTDHRVEIVRLGTGNGRLECKVDFLGSLTVA